MTSGCGTEQGKEELSSGRGRTENLPAPSFGVGARPPLSGGAEGRPPGIAAEPRIPPALGRSHKRMGRFPCQGMWRAATPQCFPVWRPPQPFPLPFSREKLRQSRDHGAGAGEVPKPLGKASGEELNQLPHLHLRVLPRSGAPGASGKRESCFYLGFSFVKKHTKKGKASEAPRGGGAGPGPPKPRLSLSISIFAFVYFYIGNFKRLYFNRDRKSVV